MSMFCFQCQETVGNKGCTIKGACGKTDNVSNLQDILIFALKGLVNYTSQLRKVEKIDSHINKFLFESLFSTITNANFDSDDMIRDLKKVIEYREEVKERLKSRNIVLDSKYENTLMTTFDFTVDEEIEDLAKKVGVLRTENEDIRSLREIILYGLKGIAAYASHASHLGYEEDSIYEFYERALLATVNDNLSVDELVKLVLETGQFGLEVMKLLDGANTGTFGNPEITKVNIGVGENPGILISGHDLRDIKQLLEQTEGTGIDVYTHSEMLPAHYYPELKKYKHLVGNYGNAWYKQTDEFETFNGPIVFTTNCLVPPKKNSTYNDKVFTLNATGFPGWKKLDRDKDGTIDYERVIELAKVCNAPKEIEQGEIVGGFAHSQTLALADKIVGAIESGAIKKFVVMSGCDARMKEREYYSEFAKKSPDNIVILTSGCAKYRYNKLGLGDIGGIPRVLDAGQCNDSYSWILVALKLKEVFNLEDVNDLPIEFNIAWYEQKAVIVLLSLLYLGVKNIHLGPTLPAFVSSNVADILNKEFGLTGNNTVEDDLKLFFNN